MVKESNLPIFFCLRHSHPKLCDAVRREGDAVHIFDIQPGDWFVDDVSSKADFERFAASVIEKLGHVDMPVNNALPLKSAGVSSGGVVQRPYFICTSICGYGMEMPA